MTGRVGLTLLASVLAAEVWVKLVDADKLAGSLIIASLGNLARAIGDLAALVFLTMTTRATFRAKFKPGEGGKTAVFMARWVSTRGTPGPWRNIASATVAARGGTVAAREATIAA